MRRAIKGALFLLSFFNASTAIADWSCRDPRTNFTYTRPSPCAKGDIVEGVNIDPSQIIDVGRLKALLAAGADVNVKDADGTTLLMLASFDGHLDVVQALIAAKADVNAKAKDGKTALMGASEKGYREIVPALLAADADVNARNANGLTPLILAAFGGHLDVVQALIAAKADVNARANNGATALMGASQNGHLDVLRALIAMKADVNAKRDDGVTALLLALENQHPDVADALITAAASQIGTKPEQPAEASHPCAPDYPKADTLVINTEEESIIEGKILYALKNLNEPIPAGPEVMFVIRRLTDKQRKYFRAAGWHFKEGGAYLWQQPGKAAFDWYALKDAKYVCDADLSLSDDQLKKVFLRQSPK